MTNTNENMQTETGPDGPRPRRVYLPKAPSVRGTPLRMGDPEGTTDGLRLNTRYVEREARPWFPVMGEYHFTRDLLERWETELRKMKSGGINVVATYLPWIIHEEIRGRVRWDGHRDLRRFIETADRVGLKVVIRIGPLGPWRDPQRRLPRLAAGATHRPPHR